MALAKDIRRTAIDPTPVYAAVGVTDLAIERVRKASVRAAAARADLDVSALQDRAIKRAEQVAEKVAEQAQQIPALAVSQTLEVAGRARETYSELAVRGEKLVTRLRTQKATKDLLAQAGSTISLGKGAVTTVRKAAIDTQHAAVSTLTTALHEAAPAVRLSTKRTATTASKRTAPAKRATRASATGARKTATKATKATKTATPKVGD